MIGDAAARRALQSARGILRGEPVPADDRQQHAAGGDMLVDDSAEIPAGGDPGHVHEDRVMAEVTGQVFQQAPRLAFRVM